MVALCNSLRNREGKKECRLHHIRDARFRSTLYNGEEMALKTRNSRNRDIENAMALLLHNQAALVAQDAKFVSRLDEDRARFARIECDLDLIKALLLKHEEMLEKLPEAIREKIGFKQ